MSVQWVTVNCVDCGHPLQDGQCVNSMCFLNQHEQANALSEKVRCNLYEDVSAEKVLYSLVFEHDHGYDNNHDAQVKDTRALAPGSNTLDTPEIYGYGFNILTLTQDVACYKHLTYKQMADFLNWTGFLFESGFPHSVSLAENMALTYFVL